MWYVGLDVHWRSSSICILDEKGVMVKQLVVKGSWDRLVEVLGGLDRPFAVCYEASCGYGHLHDRLAVIAKRVVVAHPGQLRLIFRSKRKNDRVDARKLAMILLMGQVPSVHVPSAGVRGWRQLIEYRHRLVAKRVRAKNGVRSLLRSHGLVSVRGQALWTRRGRAWLEALVFDSPTAGLRRDLLLDEIDQFTRQARRVERELDRISGDHPGVSLLRTIPGVGPRTAEAVVAYIDDARRFGRNKQVGAYFGLVPSQDASGGVNRLGHITRQGPSTVRKLIIEATWQAKRLCPVIADYFQRVQRGCEERKKIALVATGHYLLRVMAAMLRTGEVWRGVNSGPHTPAPNPGSSPEGMGPEGNGRLAMNGRI